MAVTGIIGVPVRDRPRGRKPAGVPGRGTAQRVRSPSAWPADGCSGAPGWCCCWRWCFTSWRPTSSRCSNRRRGRSEYAGRDAPGLHAGLADDPLGRGAAAGLHHLSPAHLTIGTVHPAFEEGDVYANSWAVRHPLVAVFYIVAMAALGLHLYHGAWSSLRTLGVAQASASPLKRRAAVAIAIVIAVGFAAVPLAVLGFVMNGVTLGNGVRLRDAWQRESLHGAEREESRTVRSREKWERAPVRAQAGEPREQAEVHGHRRRAAGWRAPRPPRA